MSISAEPGSPRGRTPAWNFLLFALVLVLALATIAVALDRIVLLRQDAGLINAWATDRNSVSIEQVRSIIDAEQTAIALSLLLLIALYGALYGWVRVLDQQLALADDPGWVYRLPAYFVWRISILILAALGFASFALAPGHGESTPAELIDRDNLLSWVAVARIVIALCGGWLAVSLLLASNRRFAQLPRPLFKPDDRPRMW
jgi:hypothetical protein